MYTIFSRISLSIFTLVVVYSRTKSKKHKSKKHKSNSSLSFSLSVLIYVVATIILLVELNKKSEAKKKMRSTHACTPSFATFFSNIHVSCCLFSHLQKTKKNYPQTNVMQMRLSVG